MISQYSCHKCEGKGKVWVDHDYGETGTWVECPRCKGEGIVVEVKEGFKLDGDFFRVRGRGKKI